MYFYDNGMSEIAAAAGISKSLLFHYQRNCTRAAIIREGNIIACDHVEALAKTSAKRVNLHGRAKLEKLPCVKDLQQTEDTANFLYNGDIRSLLNVLSKGEIRDISISEPDLEEIFLHYYEKGGARK